MDRVWTKFYPRGAQTEIDADVYRDLPAMIDAAIAKYADQVAFVSFGLPLTYGELDRMADAFGAYLQTACGLKPGARVAIISPNLLQFPVALLGLLRAGLAAVNINPLYTAREIDFQLSDSQAEAVLVCDSTSAALAKVLQDKPVATVIVTAIGDLSRSPLKRWLMNLMARRKAGAHRRRIAGAVSFRKALALGRARTLNRPPMTGSDLAFLQYTGGTTGRAKGAMLTHRNVVANVLQSVPFLVTGLDPQLGPGDVLVTPLPLYHIYALGAAVGFMTFGMTNVLIANPRDLDGLVKTLTPLKMRVMIGINTLFNALLHHPRFDDVDFSRLSFTVAGGAATNAHVAESWQARTGRPLLEGYGLSETSPVISVTPFLADPPYTGAAGLPAPSMDLRLLDEQGADVAEGESGEVTVRGPNVMSGYWNQPEETAKAMTRDGWFKTGDLGRIDPDGRLRIVDRKKDMILVSGFNVYPNEVEDVLGQHPGVVEAAVVGEPNDQTGESILAAVVRRDAGLTEQVLMQHARDHLAGYKRPHRIVFVDTLPKSVVGKVLRREVRALLIQSGPSQTPLDVGD